MLFFVFLILISSLNAHQNEFVSSFVENYDFNVEGRYTHEYHPFLLDKTKKSFFELEDRLKKDFSLQGRILISGYDGNAISSYYTNFKESKINDEASSLTKAGWSIKLHNRFGLMTGFLFKDHDKFVKKYFENKESKIKHINANDVEIFNDESGIFEEHAFGDSLATMINYKDSVERYFKNDQVDKILDILISYWSTLYKHELKLDRNRVAATQDILFSIVYAEYLKRSALPCIKYFTGPDVTYPIEVFVGQAGEATRNAQAFLPELIHQIKPINDQNTAYVFCSFVDGVGKSTMLGNVKNWFKFGNQVEKYERVDNSSSQYAEIFKVGEKLFIADLPAQVSHFTYKPDGMVYVDLKTEAKIEELEKVKSYAAANLQSFVEQYRNLFIEVSQITQSNNFLDAKLLAKDNPEYMFMRNLILLKRDRANNWIPFFYEGKNYLVNFMEPSEIRVLRPLSGAASSGLKNIELEQMLFDGIKFPINYNLFLDNLVDKLKSNGVQNIVFVDFISMYPRSSRENIRINYLLQQMSLLDLDFDIKNSLYKNFVSPAEIAADVLDDATMHSMKKSLLVETLLRLSLYNMLCEKNLTSLSTVDTPTVTEQLDTKMREIEHSSLYETIKDIVNSKFILEGQNLSNTFKNTKEFENVQKFSFAKLLEFSHVLTETFANVIANPEIKNIWSGLDGLVEFQEQLFVGKVQRSSVLESGEPIFIEYEFYPECKDKIFLSPFFRKIREGLYCLLTGFLFSKPVSGQSGASLELQAEVPKIVPFLLKVGQNGQIYFVRRNLPVVENENEFPQGNAITYGEFEGSKFAISWDEHPTNSFLFAFGFENNAKDDLQMPKQDALSKIVCAYKDEFGVNSVMPTSVLYERLSNSAQWDREVQNRLNFAKKTGKFNLANAKQEESYVGLADESQRLGVQLFARAIATLEMIVKDEDSDIVVRANNKQDFVAALKLIEQSLLPKYFGLVFEKPLFDDYDSVEPLIPWKKN